MSVDAVQIRVLGCLLEKLRTTPDEGTLTVLAERELVQRLPRRPGQKEDRFAQLLGGDDAVPGPSVEDAYAEPADAQPQADGLAELEERVSALAADLELLREEVRTL